MKRSCIMISILLVCFNISYSQSNKEELYGRKYIEKPPLYIVGSWLLITNELFQKKLKPLTIENISSLNPEDLSDFDKNASRKYNLKKSKISDYLLYSSIAMPLVLLPSGIKRNQLKEIGSMFLEVGTLSAGITNITKSLSQRVRPYVYNPKVPLEDKLDLNAKKSFFSGHTAMTAAFSILTASVLSGNTKHKAKKIIIWSTAISIPAFTGYLRYASGKHFPSDVIIGYLLGGTIGYLIPKFHLIKKKNNAQRISVNASRNSMLLHIKLN